MNEGFNISDCALIAIATGEKAQNLREFRDHLRTVHPGCFYYHFWGGLLYPHFNDPEFQNDFAVWASRNLHDQKISEQFAVIDPNNYSDIEDLRQEIIEIVEERLYESEHVPWAKRGQEFHFIRSQIVIFETGITYTDPRELVEAIPNMSLGSIFFHFIDSRRRTEGHRNDISVWLEGLGDEYEELIKVLDKIDPYFTTLSELRNIIHIAFNNFFKKIPNGKLT